MASTFMICKNGPSTINTKSNVGILYFYKIIFKDIKYKLFNNCCIGAIYSNFNLGKQFKKKKIIKIFIY